MLALHALSTISTPPPALPRCPGLQARQAGDARPASFTITLRLRSLTRRCVHPPARLLSNPAAGRSKPLARLVIVESPIVWQFALEFACNFRSCPYPQGSLALPAPFIPPFAPPHPLLGAEHLFWNRATGAAA